VRLAFGQTSELSVPFDWELLHQVIQLEGGRLFALQNSFDDLWREQGEAQGAAEVGFVDRLGSGEVADGGVVAGLQHVAPAVRADDRLQRCVVDARLGRGPWRTLLIHLDLGALR
jgi:hypothetical protein